MIKRKGLQFRLKTNGEISAKFTLYATAARAVWNKVWWLNNRRLMACVPILRYSDMARLLVLWKKTEELGWLRAVPSQVLQQVLMDLDRAYRDGFDKRLPGKRLPRYKPRQDSPGMRFPQGFKFNNRGIFLPKVGWVGFFKSQEIVGRLKSVTVKKDCDRWKMSVLVELEVEGVKHLSKKSTGIDVGVVKFATLSDGTVYESVDTKKLDKKIAVLQRRVARKKKPSKNRSKEVTKIQKVYAKRARILNDYSHKVSAEVSTHHAIAFLEDLRVSNITRSARGTIEKPGRNVAAKSGLNRAILHQAFRRFRTQMEYKMLWKGGLVITVDPRYTSQTCSSCGVRSAESRRSQARFECVYCGFTMNADLNAAINIHSRGRSLLAAGQAVDVCGGSAMADPEKQKPAGNRKRVLAHVLS